MKIKYSNVGELFRKIFGVEKVFNYLLVIIIVIIIYGDLLFICVREIIGVSLK